MELQCSEVTIDSDLGIVALGGVLTTETLTKAYENGIFPWPMEDSPLPWVCPPERAILQFNELKIPRSLKKVLKSHPYRVTFDQDFPAVIRACQKASRPGQPGTWITPEMLSAYTELHRIGLAHSVEVWQGSLLVGGLYGVSIRGTFAGESMFHLEPNASKIALIALIEHLQKQGLKWMDIQMVTPHMEQLGAKLISRNRFLQLLFATQKEELVFSWV